MATAVRSYIEWDQFDDDVLIRAVLSGDRELFGIIVRRYSGRVYRVALSVVRNFADAEDVVQDTFVSALQHLHQYSGRARFISWLTRIALNNSLARVSLRSRTLNLIDDEEHPLSDQLMDAAPGPEQQLVAAQDSEILKRAIEALPHHHREVIALRDLHELDTRTAARRLGITEENLKVRLHRGRRSLRSLLGAGRYDGCPARAAGERPVQSLPDPACGDRRRSAPPRG